MLHFFTNPYPDELVYSAIARYHFYSGNLDCKDTLEELFGSRSVIPSVEIGSHFFVLSERLGSQYSVEGLLTNYTIYPYYASFLSKERQQDILVDVQAEGQALYTRLGIVAGGICRKHGLYYCAGCAQSDYDQYGEPYIHREHQLQGIDYCPHHEILLRQYPVKNNSRIEYIRFDLKDMNLSPLYEVNPYKEIAVQLAKQAYKLLKLPLHSISKEEVSSKYRALLREHNLITASNRIRQNELYQEVVSHFPPGLLKQYESELNIDDEFNWLKILTRNSNRHVHPLRHLLMMYFLQQDIDEFMQLTIDQGAFGTGPFPCLNRAASHYKQLVIKVVDVTRDFKTKNLIGTFTCSCGFIYARKQTTDKFEIGRIKVFGEEWQQKLKELAEEKQSIREIARELGVDFKIVKKYLSGNVELSRMQSYNSDKYKVGQYKQELLKGIKQFPHLARTDLREKFKKQYMYLYRHDREWLYNMLPDIQRKQKPTRLVDWTKRDQQYVQQIKVLHTHLLQEEKAVRITVSKIGKRLGILANLEKNLDKLPHTKSLLHEITESVQEFQLRRCYKVIDSLLENNERIVWWRVKRIAAIKSHHFHQIKPHLEKYIREKQDVKENEQTTG